MHGGIKLIIVEQRAAQQLLVSGRPLDGNLKESGLVLSRLDSQTVTDALHARKVTFLTVDIVECPVIIVKRLSAQSAVADTLQQGFGISKPSHRRALVSHQ